MPTGHVLAEKWSVIGFWQVFVTWKSQVSPQQAFSKCNFFIKFKLLKIYSMNPNFNISCDILSKNRVFKNVKFFLKLFFCILLKKWHICNFFVQFFGFLQSHQPGEKNAHLCSGRHYEKSVTQLYMCDGPVAQPEQR